MILPGKHLPQERSLAWIGAEILASLDGGCTVSELWERTRLRRASGDAPLGFDWFILALDMLYAMSAVDVRDNLIMSSEQP